MANHDEYDAFLCYNSEDKETVKNIAEVLIRRGLKVWVDFLCMRGGRPFQKELTKIIQTAKSAIVFVGENGVGSWQELEIEGLLSEFVGNKKPVIPVLLPNASQPKLPFFLRSMSWVDFHDDITPDNVESLVWSITGLRRFIEIHRGTHIRVFDTDERVATPPLPWYLVEPPEVKRPPHRLKEAEPWKKLHTAVECLYRKQKKFLRALAPVELLDSEKHKKRVRELIDENCDDYNTDYRDFLRTIQEHFSKRLQDGSIGENDMVKLLSRLPICYRSIKEALGVCLTCPA